MSVESLNIARPEFKRQTGITPEDRSDIAKALGVVLADTYMLFIKTQGVHWNVAGPAFVSIHELTEKHYENMYQAIDDLAERIRALGEKAPASYRKYGELSSIKDEDEPQTAEHMLEMLVGDHQTAVANRRAAIGWCDDKNDYVTADMLTARMAWHEEAIWMLNALLAEK